MGTIGVSRSDSGNGLVRRATFEDSGVANLGRFPIWSKITNFIFIGIAVFLGVLFGKWIGFREFPASVLERKVITQTVQPGGELHIRLKVDRRQQCDVRVVRYFQFSDTSRKQIVQNYEAGFGPIGGDEYILKLDVPRNAPRGEAYLWSQGQSICNVLEYVFPTMGPVSIDRFGVAGPVVPELPVNE